MGEIRKKELSPHTVIVDSSILWAEDKSIVANPEFDTFWDEYSKEFKLKLVVPAVVRGELLFQQTTSAIKAMQQITEQMERISGITDKPYSHRIKVRQLKAQIAGRFDKWLRTRNGRIADTPIKNIDWASLIQRAIWREPPFVADPKNPENEKGFRDALILGTVIDVCRQKGKEIDIVFLCEDSLLRESAERDLAKYERFSTYESIKGFEAYLKFTQEALTNQFIRDLIKRAIRKFFREGDQNCLALKTNITSKLREEFADYFENPEKSEHESLLSWTTSQVTESWRPSGEGRFWVSDTQFEKLENSNVYYWLSVVTFVRLYRRVYNVLSTYTPGLYTHPSITSTSTSSSATTTSSTSTSWSVPSTSHSASSSYVPSSSSSPSTSYSHVEERVLILPFHITWRAKVTRHARFHQPSIVNIDLKNNSFQPLTEKLRKAYDLRSEST